MIGVKIFYVSEWLKGQRDVKVLSMCRTKMNCDIPSQCEFINQILTHTAYFDWINSGILEISEFLNAPCEPRSTTVWRFFLIAGSTK